MTISPFLFYFTMNIYLIRVFRFDKIYKIFYRIRERREIRSKTRSCSGSFGNLHDRPVCDKRARAWCVDMRINLQAIKLENEKKNCLNLLTLVEVSKSQV